MSQTNQNCYFGSVTKAVVMKTSDRLGIIKYCELKLVVMTVILLNLPIIYPILPILLTFPLYKA